MDFRFSFVSDRETYPVASISAAESIYASVATVSTTYHSAQATRVSLQEGNFPMAETSTAAIPAQLTKSSSSKEQDNFSVQSENSEIDWTGKSTDNEEPEEGNKDFAFLNFGDWVAPISKLALRSSGERGSP
ncbi:hypothetical protein ILUMI_22762 [Ignelater luminosus]|uniref:Uncharacterized protein n=1 Tax=Ignelater luminosus TaxID=2038154 RepID=A0A8K0CF69_IGNLU|nr:hypothetical protein ILUMI_22762 [Ignelater luminosus]